ncbi:efflux transporter, RND family, MFP subunit [Isosphaera pallida ATCC 43644]|uniref:Efflux transporter, RND family, MFP subunit n=2 Tax=Isosphaera pallida TaxID=128 RepID=E8QXV6_ISOPI|nr:efflux transporter, RND family, MFP subunit [Isosphaera pallida ATCC 43644]
MTSPSTTNDTDSQPLGPSLLPSLSPSSASTRQPGRLAPRRAEPDHERMGWGETLQFLAALSVTLGVLGFLLVSSSTTPPSETVEEPRPVSELVQVIGPGQIRVEPDGPFASKIEVVSVTRETRADPILTVTGRVAASLRPLNGTGTPQWQFDSPADLTAFTEWERAKADVEFAQIQLVQVRQLAAARIDAQRKLVERLEKLVVAGSETPRDLATERAALIEVQITGRREIHEAETALRIARRLEAAQIRQLQQSGLDPTLLESVSPNYDLVIADVPEAMVSRVRVGQGCSAVFFGLPDRVFQGRVQSIAPVLSPERRSLRVQFLIDDFDDELRPGMFAEIGLGTDLHDALLIPAEAVLHLGRFDYVLAANLQTEHVWNVTRVVVGEPREGRIEVLAGLSQQDRVVGSGAILFKPMMREALQLTARNGSSNDEVAVEVPLENEADSVTGPEPGSAGLPDQAAEVRP